MSCPRCHGPLVTSVATKRDRYFCEGCGFRWSIVEDCSDAPEKLSEELRLPLKDILCGIADKLAATEAEHAKALKRIERLERMASAASSMMPKYAEGEAFQVFISLAYAIRQDLANHSTRGEITDPESMSDEEIIADTIASGLDPSAEAERVRGVLLDAARHAILEKRLERTERTLVDLTDTLIDLINQVAADPAYLAGPWEERVDTIRQDLAEIDRNRQTPKTKE